MLEEWKKSTVSSLCWVCPTELRADCWHTRRVWEVEEVCFLICNGSIACGWQRHTNSWKQLSKLKWLCPLLLPLHPGVASAVCCPRLYWKCSDDADEWLLPHLGPRQDSLGATDSEACVFSSPGVIADNGGRVILNHLIFTAGTSVTEASWLMSGLRPNHPVWRNHGEPTSRVEMLCLFSNNRRWWHTEETEEMKRESQVEAKTCSVHCLALLPILSRLTCSEGSRAASDRSQVGVRVSNLEITWEINERKEWTEKTAKGRKCRTSTT